MTKEEIQAGNRLIAEFMGWTSKSYPSHIKSPFHGREVWWSAGTTKGFCGYVGEEIFHSSWEMLMPVVEKICRLKIGDGIKTIYYAYPRTFGMLNPKTSKILVRLNGSFLYEGDTLIEATYPAIIDFIKWYSQLNQEK